MEEGKRIGGKKGGKQMEEEEEEEGLWKGLEGSGGREGGGFDR